VGEWGLIYYETAGGSCPVRQYIDSLSVQEAARLSVELDLLADFGVALGMPHVRPVGGKLHELRVRGRIQHRVLYVATTGQYIVSCMRLRKRPRRPQGRRSA
jgi:phage-related protein